MSKHTKMINLLTQASPEKHNSTAKWTTLLRQQFSKPRPIRGTRQNAFPSNRYASSLAKTRLHWIKGNVSGFGHIGSWRGEGSMTPKSSLESNSTWLIGKWCTWPLAKSPGCSKSGPASRLWTSPQPTETILGNAPSARFVLAAPKPTRHAHTSYFVEMKGG